MNAFDRISEKYKEKSLVCNSALQWFSDPDRAIAAIFNSLKKSGKLGLACPATSNWSPWFGRIIPKVTENREIKRIFSHWKNPWFHLPTEKDYRLFFEKHGFVTIFMGIDHEQTDYSIEEAFNIYLSGAANGYTGKKYYDIEIDDGYIAAFNDKVKKEIMRQSNDGFQSALLHRHKVKMMGLIERKGN